MYFGTSSVAEQKGSLAAKTFEKLPITHADLSTLKREMMKGKG